MQDKDTETQKEIEKLKMMAKQYETAYMKCLGIIEYLENPKKDEDKKKDK